MPVVAAHMTRGVLTVKQVRGSTRQYTTVDSYAMYWRITCTHSYRCLARVNRTSPSSLSVPGMPFDFAWSVRGSKRGYLGQCTHSPHRGNDSAMSTMNDYTYVTQQSPTNLLLKFGLQFAQSLCVWQVAREERPCEHGFRGEEHTCGEETTKYTFMRTCTRRMVSTGATFTVRGSLQLL
jgi:hypothetical protein